MRTNPLVCRVLALAFLVSLILCPATPTSAQAPKAPAPAPRRPTAPAKPAAPKAAEPPPAPAAAKVQAADVQFKSKYTTGDQVTESVTYLHGARERYELSDMILLRQHDQNRVVQISRASNTYLVTPEGVSSTSAPVDPAAASRPPGVVMVVTSIVDTGERKTLFDQQARHVKTVIDRQPLPGACDQSKLRIETDGWYIDLPKGAPAPQDTDNKPAATAGCRDELKTTQNGDPKALGFPITYTTTFVGADGKSTMVSMEVTEFHVATLDAALFEIPSGLTPANNIQELSKAVSNAAEAKLASGETLPGVTRDKKPGTLRVGVPEVANKTTQQVDTRALRTRLISELTDSKVDAVPMAAAPQPQLEQRANELGVDYLLMAEITELKASKPGGLSKFVKSTAGDTSAGKDVTEAKLSVQLVPPGGKARLSTTTSGKDGGIGVKTGLGLAKVAGSMYMSMYMGGMMYGSPMSALNTMQTMNMGGMGMLGNPSLMAMQTGMGGLDRTAGAASFLMDQAMTGGASGGGQGPSFDTSLGSAIEDAAKNVVDTLKKPDTAKKK